MIVIKIIASKSRIGKDFGEYSNWDSKYVLSSLKPFNYDPSLFETLSHEVEEFADEKVRKRKPNDSVLSQAVDRTTFSSKISKQPSVEEKPKYCNQISQDNLCCKSNFI